MDLLRIMVVDDDEVFQFTAKKTLQFLGIEHQVFAYTSSRKALAHLAEAGAGGGLPHFIFLDINMPVVDGWLFMDEFVRLKSEFDQIPRVFIVSSSIDPGDMKRAADHPDIEGYIEKPISPDKYREILIRR